METVTQIRQERRRGWRLPALVIGLTLCILGLTIAWSSTRLREKTREQIANHDGEILHAISLLQQAADESRDDLLSSLDDPAEQFNLMLRISRLQGVLGIRLFTPAGKFYNAFPAYITEAELPSQELASLRALKPVSHYCAKGQLGDVDLLAQTNGTPVPLLVVDIPVHLKDEAHLLGVAQFIIQGGSIAREYAELDRNLLLQAAVAFAASGGILALALALAFRRIQHANQLLSKRTESLWRANQELALAAKTSAVGAVAAHLIHGLKNPLSGLQGFVSGQLENQSAADDPEWQEAAATTQRMQSLIARVVRVLEEQQGGEDFEVAREELVEIISSKMLPAAKLAGIRLTVESGGDGVLSNRDASLVMLIIENLVQNAIDETPSGKKVSLRIGWEGGQFVFQVRDEGPGFPAALKERLFAPCRSAKAGGSGIGLAISRQLANHLGAVLELKENAPTGCIFRLSLPPRRLAPEWASGTAEAANC